MGIAERKERQKKEVRESILQSAWHIVKEEGWQTLSIRKIADAIEYSVPVVYDHFENKEAILFEFTKQGFGLLRDKLSEAVAHHHAPARQLTAIANAYWQFAFDNKEYYQVMYGLGMPGCEQVRQIPEIMEFTGLIRETIERIMNEKSHTESESFLKLHSFWSMLHGLVSINLMTMQSSRGPVNGHDMNQMILDDFTKGFIKGLQE